MRVWVIDADGSVLERLTSDRGMGTLAPEDFEGALLALIDGHLPEGQVTPVICCGMVGARQGWAEAPYVAVPCAPGATERAIRAPSTDPRLSVHIWPGLGQDRPADVMRGEETQIAGFLSAHRSTRAARGGSLSTGARRLCGSG